MVEFDQRISDAAEVLRSELEPLGWKVSLRPRNVPTLSDETHASVNLEHPLSTSMSVLLDANDDCIAFARRFLDRSEIRAVAAAPDEMPNRALVAGLRRAATAAGPAATPCLVAFSRVLVNHGVLTEDESVWLETAGVPWMQEAPQR